MPPLKRDDEALISGGIRHKGFDVLAFYKSRRFLNSQPFPGHWGIFYLKDGITFIAHQIEHYYPTYGSPMDLALEFLRRHEHLHYRADVQTLVFEATLKKKLYLPVRRLLGQRPDLFVEEALANRQVWDWAKKPRVGLQDMAEDILSLQPGEYARFQENKLDLAAEWAGIVVDQSPPGVSARDDLKHWVEATPKQLLSKSLCPEYAMSPSSLAAWISPACNLPPVRAINDEDAVKKTCAGRYANYAKKWDKTKEKLLENPSLPGLAFKPWPKDGPDCCSVKIDKGFRGHLRHLGSGHWSAYKIGPHKEMGHG